MADPTIYLQGSQTDVGRGNLEVGEDMDVDRLGEELDIIHNHLTQASHHTLLGDMASYPPSTKPQWPATSRRGAG